MIECSGEPGTLTAAGATFAALEEKKLLLDLGWAAAATSATAAKGSAAVGDMPAAACGGAPAPRALFNSPRAQEVGLDGEVSAAASEGTRMAKDALSRSFQVREASQSGASSHVSQSEAY